jgi:sulfate adenylyltransferase subunit 2
LTDPRDTSASALLRRHIAVTARRKRQHVFIMQIAPLPDGRPCLHAHDARGARFWYPLSHPDTPYAASRAAHLDAMALQLAWQSLEALHPRGIVVLPYGELAERVHDLSDLPSTPIPPLFLQRAAESPEAAPVTLPTLGQRRNGQHLDPSLQELEAESLHMLREAIGGSKNPVLLFSAGKDSAVLLHLARKAFYPAKPPLPMLHIDTRWKFRAMYRYRDQSAEAAGLQLHIHVNPQAIAQDINPFDHGPTRHTEITKTQALRQALDAGGYDTIIAGARRDEEKSRAKEKRFSIRSAGHRWDPRRQRPEPWNLYHTGLGRGESLRVFPLSNWTELDVWRYIDREQLPLVDLYFSALRPVVHRDGQLIVLDDARFRLEPRETFEYRRVRFRSLGCYPLTAAFESDASTVPQIIDELLNSHKSERGGRVIDLDQPGSMELKKREGYF